jgi:hypothetical protein
MPPEVSPPPANSTEQTQADVPADAAPVGQTDDAAPVHEPLATPTSVDVLDTDLPKSSE